jgi:glycosyltransferase involved in cell wall biosynthesis
MSTSIGKNTLKKIFDYLWGTKLLFNASNLIALNSVEFQQYLDLGIPFNKIQTIPNGINLGEYGALPNRGLFRKKWGIPDEKKVILFLGRLNKIKGLDILAEAYAALLKEENILPVIAGPDDGYLLKLRQQLVSLDIDQKILFTGPLYGFEKQCAYRDSDVYVLPSIYETFPISVLEALACETPVIITNRCGIADMIDGIAGIVIPYDSHQLYHSISQLLNDNQLRLKLGENGRKMVTKNFNWESIIKSMESTYLTCIQRKQ